MSDFPEGYQHIPEEDRKRANVFFEKAKAVADAGQYEYAIDMYIQGLDKDPENVEAHQALRDISLKRKVSGGKDLGMFEKMKLSKPSKDDKQNMLNYEKLLAYDAGNKDRMLGILQNAHRAGFYDTVLWIGPILQKANADAPKPDYNKFIILKDIYKDLHQWQRAVEACHYAAMLHPQDMDLQTELKNLGAHQTMQQGKYLGGGSYRDSIRDMDKQRALLDQDKDVRTPDFLQRAIAQAEAEWKAEPNEAGKLMKYVDALLKTEDPQYENLAIEVLDEAHQRTGQFRFRGTLGQIKMIQLNRQERALRHQYEANKTDDELKQQYAQFLKEKTEEELKEYSLAAEAYPTDMVNKFEMGKRLFLLRRYDEAIPVFQQARSDPKFRSEAAVYLGQSFLGAGFLDESIDTFRDSIEAYGIKGDTRSKDMYYWYGRALEQKGESQPALKAYSQVAQWDFNYRDVQSRIKTLRAK